MDANYLSQIRLTGESFDGVFVAREKVNGPKVLFELKFRWKTVEN